MKISIIVNPIYVYGSEGWSPESVRLGGSEECVVEWGRRLVSRGHQVKVFHNGKHGAYDGVKYLPHAKYEPGDISLNVNYPQFHHTGKAIYWTSLTNNPDLSKFNAVCALSQYALDNTNILHKNTYIVPPGYDPIKIYPEEKIPKQCLYASSPDRGLDVLLEAWPKVYEAHPDATLIVTYGAEGRNIPGVTFLGEVDEDLMSELFRTSDVWAYPCTGVELYGMTGIKAQVAHCTPVIIPHMALSETVEFGVFCNRENYTESLIKTLSGIRTKDWREIHYGGWKFPTWEDSTDKLLEVMQKVLV